MLDLSIDIDDAVRGLDELQLKQLPFAMALSLNQVQEVAQGRVRESLTRDFTIAPKRVDFLKKTIRFERQDRATKSNLAARMGITGQAGTSRSKSGDRRQILGRHEEGGEQTARDPMRPFFLPTDELRPGPYDEVKRSLYPSALRIHESRGIVSYTVGADGKKKGLKGTLLARSRVTSRGKVQLIGKQRTFVIDGRATGDPRTWGIWQRFGPRKEDIRLLWAYRDRIDLPPRLRLYETVDLTVGERFDDVFHAALERALASAR